jgi:hypothetical protein
VPVIDVPAASRPSRLPRFGVLLAVMILEVMLAPLLPDRDGGPPVSELTIALTLTAALVAVGIRRGTLLLFAVAVGAVAAEGVARTTPTEVVALAMRMVFLGYVLARVVRNVLTDRVVTHDTVAGVACGYVLLGLVWGALYAFLETLRPGSFLIPEAWRTGTSTVRALTYLSFVTLSGLGQGDLLPAGPPAGGLCIGEAIVGQLYMGIMIARMVGILAAQRA